MIAQKEKWLNRCYKSAASRKQTTGFTITRMSQICIPRCSMRTGDAPLETDVNGPVPPLASRFGDALQLHQTCHSCAEQHFRKASDRHADIAAGRPPSANGWCQRLASESPGTRRSKPRIAAGANKSIGQARKRPFMHRITNRNRQMAAASPMQTLSSASVHGYNNTTTFLADYFRGVTVVDLRQGCLPLHQKHHNISLSGAAESSQPSKLITERFSQVCNQAKMPGSMRSTAVMTSAGMFRRSAALRRLSSSGASYRQ